MSDFNLLGFLNINVPNEPLSPIIVTKKENSKILSPSSKPELYVSTSTPKRIPELSSTQRPPELDSSSPKNDDKVSTPKNIRHSPFFRTTYGQSFGTTEESQFNSSSVNTDADQAPPQTPNSVSSVSSISSTISQCNDPLCDDCLTKKQLADKGALAAHERELERLAFEESVKKQQEEIAKERRKEEEKKERERQETEQDMQRIRAQRAAERAQKEQEAAEDAVMQRELSRIDNRALEAVKARNREYSSAIQSQIGDERARHAAEIELSKKQEVGYLGFGGEQDMLDQKRRAADRENAHILEQQIAEKRAEGDAEHAADAELKKRYAEEEAAYKAQKAAENEQKKIRDAELLRKNKDFINEKRNRAQAAEDEEKEFQRAQAELERMKAEEEKRKADAQNRAELEALHQQLAVQVQRRRDALQQAREEEKLYATQASGKKKSTLIHCFNCERDLTGEHFSNFIVTPDGKVYKRSKAIPKNSPLHKYLHHAKESGPYDFGHTDS